MGDDPKIRDDHLGMVEALETVYGKHFPNTSIDAAWEAYWLSHTIFSMPWPAWDHDSVADLIAELARALRVLQRVDDLPQSVSDALHFDAFRRSENFDGPISPSDAVLVLPELHDLLIPSIRAAKVAALDGHPKGRTNWDAVTAIDACRTSWWRCTGKVAPKGSDLNLSTPFGEFVRDAFAALQIDGNPRAAMAAWHRIQSSEQ